MTVTETKPLLKSILPDLSPNCSDYKLLGAIFQSAVNIKVFSRHSFNECLIEYKRGPPQWKSKLVCVQNYEQNETQPCKNHRKFNIAIYKAKEEQSDTFSDDSNLHRSQTLLTDGRVLPATFILGRSSD